MIPFVILELGSQEWLTKQRGSASILIIMKHEKTGIDVHGVVNVEFFRRNRAREMVDFFLGDDDSTEHTDDFTFFNIADGINALFLPSHFLELPTLR